MTITAPRTGSISTSIQKLTEVFHSADSKHDAHASSREILAEMARDPAFLTETLRGHVGQSANLNRRHFPVMAFAVESNPEFEVVVNCWIPLPNRATNISTKSIHHHGPMLLTTATAFGPGYEHWMLRRPELVDAGHDLFRMELLQRGRHALHEVAFVDAYVAHLPIYPASLTITVCLWSNQAPTTWRDTLKRTPMMQRHAPALRAAAARAGLARGLDLKVDTYKDYYPGERGFVGIKDRQEFPHTTNEDYLYSLFHILQETGNASLGSVIDAQVSSGGVTNPSLARQLVEQLRSEIPIAGRLSAGHYGVAHANFTTADVERALAAQA